MSVAAASSRAYLASLGLALGLLLPAASFADNVTPATAAQYVVGQGYVMLSGIGGLAPGRFYTFNVVPGRSYCAETAAGDFSTDSVDTKLFLYNTAKTQVALNDDMQDEPSAAVLPDDPEAVGPYGPSRLCWIAPAGQSQTYVEVRDRPAGIARRFRVSDTSMWAPWFFSGSGFEAFILIKNTTNRAQTVAVSLYQTTGIQNGATQTATIPANGSLNYQVSAAPFSLTSATGTVQISHTGAPGALVAGVTSLSFASGVSFDVTASPRLDFRQ